MTDVFQVKYIRLKYDRILYVRLNPIMRYRIFCYVLFTAAFKLSLGVLCAEHIANREVKDLVDDVKAKSFLPSNDQYFLDSSFVTRSPGCFRLSLC